MVSMKSELNSNDSSVRNVKIGTNDSITLKFQLGKDGAWQWQLRSIIDRRTQTSVRTNW